MDTVSEIQEAILRLSPSELKEFRAWFVEFDTIAREPQVKSDMSTSGLDALASKSTDNKAE